MRLKPLRVGKKPKAKIWTPEQIQAFKKLYPVAANLQTLAEQFGRTSKALRSKAKMLKLSRERKSNDPWTDERIANLKLWYRNTENEIIGERLGLRETQVSAKAFKLGLKKDPEFMYMHSMRTAFKKGQAPPNKGKRQKEYMSAEAIERTKATRFKKGSVPGNTLHDWAITIRHSSALRGRKPYKMIRLSQGKWQELQRYNWEKVHGAIPKGMCLWCKNGDTMNCEPDNWELITRAENVKRNSGSLHLKDGVVALYILGKNNATPENIEAIKSNKKLIEAKRLQLQLKRTINEQSRKNK